MGYSTDFQGRFKITPPLTDAHRGYLKAFNSTRRMKRDPGKAELLPDPIREAVALPIGHDGEYFVGGLGFKGQGDDGSVIDHNEPPGSPVYDTGRLYQAYADASQKAIDEGEQPGLWCKWIPTEDGTGLEWDKTEKFLEYTHWLEYLIARFFVPWGYSLAGTITWQGEDPDDIGDLALLVDNVLDVHRYPPPRRP